jgi:hypothetical protein
MSGATVSISLTKKQQGDLYMQNMQRGERIKEYRAGVKRIVGLAEAAGNWEIAIAAKALLEVPKKEPA